MPTYVYKFIDSGETIEVQQSFTDETLTEYVHPTTGAVLPVKKVFQPVGVTFKGSGFFRTDNRGSKSSSSSSDSASSSDAPASDSKTEPSTTADPKSKSTKDAKSATAPVPAAAKSD